MGIRRSGMASVFIHLVRYGLGAVLLGAGASKLAHPYDFLSAVYDYGLTTPLGGYVTAYWLPWIEVVMGICLLMQICELGASVLSVMLFAAFVFVKTTAVHRDLQVGCGCIVSADRGVIGVVDVILAATGLFAALVLAWALRGHLTQTEQRRVVADL